MENLTGTNLWLSVVYREAMLWGVPQMVIAGLAFVAAWRNKSVGIWLLAVAAAMTVIMKVRLAMIIRHGESPRNELLGSYLGILALSVAIAGWAILAFSRSKNAQKDA